MRAACRLVVLSLLVAGLSSPLWAQCNTCPERRTIAVNGEGTVTADADLAIVHVGYKLYGPDARTDYASALTTSNAIMDALTASGIPKSAIESTGQVLQPTQTYEYQQYPVESDQWRNRQFTVMQSWVLRVKPDLAAKALNTAINAGANESGWIEWIVQKPTALEAEASAKALANARLIAEQMAAKAGVQLGHLVSVNENQGSPQVGMINGSLGSLGAGNGVFDRIQVGNQQLAVNSRRVEFRATVYATFAIE
ncbi:MAG TPA: SIMPL domain-containing protein [Terracidiphilus sp.]|nr:SIMPL domain-containing protein [Terracidiphilus sp.]